MILALFFGFSACAYSISQLSTIPGQNRKICSIRYLYTPDVANFFEDSFTLYNSRKELIDAYIFKDHVANIIPLPTNVSRELREVEDEGKPQMENRLCALVAGNDDLLISCSGIRLEKTSKQGVFQDCVDLMCLVLGVAPWKASYNSAMQRLQRLNLKRVLQKDQPSRIEEQRNVAARVELPESEQIGESNTSTSTRTVTAAEPLSSAHGGDSGGIVSASSSMTSLSSGNVQCENDSSGIDLNRVVRKEEFEEIEVRFNFDCASIFQHLADGGLLQSLRNRKPFTTKNVYTRVFRVKKDLKERPSTASHSSRQSFGGVAAPESTSASLVSNGSSQSSVVPHHQIKLSLIQQ
eukprot:Nk52_evm15s156 gene=Nk52_evmTU15s156